MLDDLYKDVKKRMRQAVEKFEEELKGVRTGRASPGVFENLKVDYYGVPTPVKQLASFSVPEPRLVVIQPWDKSVAKEIEKVINSSDIGVKATSDGTVVRVSFPPLTEERRRDLVKFVRKRAEEYRIAIRNVRRDANEEIKELEKNKQISEDDSKRAIKEIQNMTDEFIRKIDELLDKKEKEIMEF